jgi:hypothetical protein
LGVIVFLELRELRKLKLMRGHSGLGRAHFNG